MLPPDRTFSVNRSGNNLITECPGTDSVLKEIEDEEASEVMKTGLFQYLVGNQEYGQIIIAEHDIPELDYSSVNIIKFTLDCAFNQFSICSCAFSVDQSVTKVSLT